MTIISFIDHPILPRLHSSSLVCDFSPLTSTCSDYPSRMEEQESARIEAMQKRLPTNQQQQVNEQVMKYRQSLVTRGVPKASVDQACFVFWKTIVTKLFAVSSGAPPPPPSRPHPLAVPVKRVQGPVMQLVDKSNGLLGRLLPGSSLPVGLQDWVNRVYLVIEKSPNPTLRSKVEEFVTLAVRSLIQNGDLWKTNWVSYPIPSLNVFTGVVDVVVLDEPPRKVAKTKVKQPVEEFIPISKVPLKRRSAATVDDEEMARRNQRAMKYRDHLLIDVGSAPATPEQALNLQYEFGNDEEDVFEKTGQYSVVGTSKTMEKRYLRLTSAPDPALVRPEPVLKKWLTELERLWTTNQKDWKYIEDQMRAIRQDLTVQNLRGPFTRKVYELNARWALEGGDLGQFNQCQTQLRQLHESEQDISLDVRVEFLAYRLLYYTFQNLRVDEQIFLNRVLADRAIRDHPFMKFVLRVRSASVTSNFSQYFQLGKQARLKGQVVAPSHAHYLIHAFDNRQRMQALVVLTKAIATPITVAWLVDILGFSSDSDCRSFLAEQNAVMKSELAIDPKLSQPVFSESPLLFGNKLKLMG